VSDSDQKMKLSLRRGLNSTRPWLRRDQILHPVVGDSQVAGFAAQLSLAGDEFCRMYFTGYSDHTL
jgi:hypothetical protein